MAENSANGYYPVSINWEDDAAGENRTVNERNDDNTIRYQGGVARVSTERIDQMMQEPPFYGAIHYSRDPIPQDENHERNEYHGNLWLNEEKVKQKIFSRPLYRRLKFTIVSMIPPLNEV